MFCELFLKLAVPVTSFFRLVLVLPVGFIGDLVQMLVCTVVVLCQPFADTSLVLFKLLACTYFGFLESFSRLMGQFSQVRP